MAFNLTKRQLVCFGCAAAVGIPSYLLASPSCLHEPTPQELLERMEMFCRLWNALNSLPEVQGRRIDAHIILYYLNDHGIL